MPNETTPDLTPASLSRRETIGLVAGAAALASAASAPAAAQSPAPAAASGPFTLPPLPYAQNALLPVLDAETLMLHHDKHHATYVKGLNDALAAKPELAGLSLDAIMARVSSLPPAFRNNAGQHYAHSLYWEVMAPPGKGGAPSEKLLAALKRDLGGLDAMKTAFEKAGATRFGSGWAWLIANADGTLAVTSTANANTPLMDDAEVKGRPLLVNDVWEHAYYLTYRNRRAEYLTKWWDVVNWNRVNKLYDEATAAKR